MLVAQVRQVVTGQATVEFGEYRFDQIGLGLLDIARHPIHFADTAGLRASRLQFRVGQRMAVQALTAEQHAVQFQYVVTGLAIGATALAAGVGVDHAADGGTVGRRQLRREEQPVRFERGIELILDHARLHPHPALGDVDFEDGVHVPRQVDHDAIGQ
ncbi:hypothetical protein D3C87_776820 [compost metagenome]